MRARTIMTKIYKKMKIIVFMQWLLANKIIIMIKFFVLITLIRKFVLKIIILIKIIMKVYCILKMMIVLTLNMLKTCLIMSIWTAIYFSIIMTLNVYVEGNMKFYDDDFQNTTNCKSVHNEDVESSIINISDDDHSNEVVN